MADDAIKCTYSGISHEDRTALWMRPVNRYETMWYCEECKQRLPPDPYNLKENPPKPLAVQGTLL